MSNEVAMKDIEIYLSDLTDYMLAMGVSPKVALAQAEEVADVVVSTEVDPLDEYGPAEDYARTVADALDVRSRLPVLRALAAGFSFYLFMEAFGGFLYEGSRTIDPLNPQPHEMLWTPLAAFLPGLLMFFGALNVFSTGVIRVVVSRVNRLPRIGAALLIALFTVGIIVAIPFTFDVAKFYIEVPDRVVMIPFLGVVTAAGLALFWFSGLAQLFFAVAESGFRPGSNLRYNMFSTRKVRIRESRRPLAPTPGGVEA